MKRAAVHFSITAGRVLLLALTGLLLGTSCPRLAAADTVITACTETNLDNALFAGGTITFNCGPVPVTIVLHTTKMISTSVDLQGGGLITLSGARAVSHFQVFFGQSLSLSGVTLTQGSGTFGAIQNFGTLTITNSQLVDNQSSANGGAIENFGTLSITDCTLSNNRAAQDGGAIDHKGADLSISASQLSGNIAQNGGALFTAVATTATIVDAQITNNRAPDSTSEGGGIYNGGTMTITNSLVVENHAGQRGGGIRNDSNLTLDHVTLSRNSAQIEGGGLRDAGEARTSLQDVIFDRNSAAYGGGLLTSGSRTTMQGVTFTGNVALAEGGGIFLALNPTVTSPQTVDLVNVTISGNTVAGQPGVSRGGGIYYRDGGLLRLTNVTLADNTAGTGAGENLFIEAPSSVMEMTATLVRSSPGKTNCFLSGGKVASKGFNLVTDFSCGVQEATDNPGLSFTLGGLAPNGGATPTRLLLSTDNLAHDTSQCFAAVTTDQRGVARPQGVKCDIGAVEMRTQDFAPGASPLAAVLPSSRSIVGGTTATAFVTIINSGTSTARQVGIGLAAAIPAVLDYQTTNPATNAVTGTPNTPVDIPPGGSQTYVISVSAVAGFDPVDAAFSFAGANTESAGTVVGLNTLLISASGTPVPDIVALAATPTNDGIVNIPSPAGSGAFAVATVNVGVSGNIVASADTGTATLLASVMLCQTNPGTGACLAPPSPTVATTINAGATPTFGVFVTGAGTVPFDPATNRIFVRFKDAGGVTRGSTSVAVRTQP